MFKTFLERNEGKDWIDGWMDGRTDRQTDRRAGEEGNQKKISLSFPADLIGVSMTHF